MATIQEALAVLDRRRQTPLSGLLSGFAGGVANAQDKALQNAVALIELERKQKQEEERIQNQRKLQQIISNSMEQRNTNDKKKLGPTPLSPNPSMRLNEIAFGEGGATAKFKVDKPEGDDGFTSKEYYDPITKQKRIGKWDKSKGLVKSPDDPIADAPASGLPPPPKGYAYGPDGKSLIPLPGGPGEIEWRKELRDLSEYERKLEKREEKLGERTVIQDAGRAITILEKNRLASGPAGAALQYVPFTDAQAVAKLAESMKSNISIDRLQAMREASPTGGALGQVPVQQQVFLMQVLGSLDLSQKPEIVQDNFKRVFNIYADIVHGEGEGPPRFPLSFDEFGRPKNQQWPGITREMESMPKGKPMKVGRFTVVVED